jgi:F-type H+-transporting ATPase subunit a
LENKKQTPWRRWVVLGLMIAGAVLAVFIPPVRPEIGVAAERLSEHPLFTLPAPFGPFYLVNTLTTLAATIFLLLVLEFFTNRSIKRSLNGDLVPRGVGNFMEALLDLLYNLTEGSAGAKWARVIFPWFATILIYVLFANLLKLIPGFESIGVLHPASPGHPSADLGGGWTGILPGEVENGYVLVPLFRGVSLDLNFTFALAVISVIAIQVVGFRAQGFGYLSKFFNVRRMFKVPFFGAMDFLVGLIELFSEIMKVVSFAFRLFFNMFAGLILVAVAAFLLGKVTIVSSMLYLFELFVGLIQAFVFGMLTMVFMAMATQGHAEEHAEAH